MSIISQIGVVILIAFIVLVLIRSNKNLKKASEEGENFVDEWALRQEKKEEIKQKREEKKLEVQITTWGNRVAADQGGLRDYAHKEWNGILKDFYFMRWKAYFDYLACVLDGKQPEELDFYTLEEAWTKETGFYSSIPEGNTVVVAKNIFEEVF